MRATTVRVRLYENTSACCGWLEIFSNSSVVQCGRTSLSDGSENSSVDEHRLHSQAAFSNWAGLEWMSSETRWQTQGLMASRRWAKITTPSIQEPWSIITIKCEQCFLTSWRGGRWQNIHKREQKGGGGNCILALDQRDWDAGRKETVEERRGEANLMSEIGLRGEKKSVEMDESEAEGDWGGNQSKVKIQNRDADGLVRATKPWLHKLGMIKKEPQCLKKPQQQKKKKKKKRKTKKKTQKKKKKKGDTHRERERNRKSPQRKAGENEKMATPQRRLE